jgi:hypothetical protein
MSVFHKYFDLGKEYILDYATGYEHILFMIVLFALYLLQDWKQVLYVFGVFIVSYTITLTLVTYKILPIEKPWIDFLVPSTILITAISNLFKSEDAFGRNSLQSNYYFASTFGLVHGISFASYFGKILPTDNEFAVSLLAYNTGLMIGQLIIIAIYLAITFLLVDLINVSRRDWKLVISSAIAGIAITLVRNHLFWME